MRIEKFLKNGLCGLSLSASVLTNLPLEAAQPKLPSEATFIPLNAQPGKESELEKFLKIGAQLVSKNEPKTLVWMALRSKSGTFGIVDMFADVNGRNLHFSGKAATRLKKRSSELVSGGWNDGVIKNVGNYGILSTTEVNQEKLKKSKLAQWITIQAREGKEADLANLLSKGASIVAESEPKTLYWLAARPHETQATQTSRTFVIFDTFENDEGISAHFAGKVAGLLKVKASELVEGGWEQGVVQRVSSYSIIAMRR